MDQHPLSQVRLFNAHPTGAMNKAERLETIMGDGGLANCGNSQNCVQSCPKGIPLTTSIAALTVIQQFNHLEISLEAIKFNRNTKSPLLVCGLFVFFDALTIIGFYK